MKTNKESVLVVRDKDNLPIAVVFFKGKDHSVHLTARAGMDDIERLLNNKLEDEKV